MTKILVVANDFYKRPAGRYKTDGQYSGEAFREDYLLPELRKLTADEKLIVNFDGVTMSASSFLEEAFGGLVRKGYFSAEVLKQKLEIHSSRQVISDKVWEYINSATSIV